MRLDRSQLYPLILVLVLSAWVVGLFFLPANSWLKPFARGPVETLSGPLQVARSDGRPGRARLPQIRLGQGQSRLLILRVAPGGAFSLQVKDHGSGQVARVFRFPRRTRTTDLWVALDSSDLPRRLRLTLWNRNRSLLEIESATVQGLGGGYRWAPWIYWLAGPLLLIWVGVRRRDELRRYLSDDGSFGELLSTPGRDGLTAALVFLFCFTVFRLAPVHQILDSKFITVVSHSVITAGTVALPDDFARARRARQIYTLRPVGEKTYHFFSSAPAVLNVPIVALFEITGISSVGAEGEFLGHHERRILRFIAAAVAAALCSVLFLLARVWLPPGWSLGLTLTFAFGTQIFSTISRPFWSHSWSTLLLGSALLLLAMPRFKARAASYLWISTLLCWAYFCRPPLSLAVVGVALLVCLTRRRFWTPFLVTGLVWAGLFALYAWRNYDSLLPPYFLSSHLESGRLAGGLLLTSYPEGLVGTLLSPGRGLFVYVPTAALVLVVVTRYWRWLPDKALAATAMGVCLAHWQLVSLFRNWWGGQSFGPRLMSDLVPWLFLLTVLGVAALRAAGAEDRFRWTPLKWVAVGLIVAVSVFINTRGAVAQETQRGAGIWNWRYPQFLAGLIPRPSREVPADSDRPAPPDL